jgi:hypothetical protein
MDLEHEQSDRDGDDRIAERDDSCRIALDAERVDVSGPRAGSVIA